MSTIAGMNSFVDTYVVSYGLAAILVLMTLESALIPIPSELVMTLAGVLAASGKLSLVGAIAVGILGNLIGSVILWAIGRTGGRVLVERFGRFVLVKPKDLDRAERWFQRHGEAAVIVSRLLPVVRSVISLPAGVAEMPVGKFSLYTLIGSIPFVALLTLAGYWLGSNYTVVVKVIQDLGYGLGAVLALLIIGFLWFRYRRRSNLEAIGE
ncbi:DedA family protein [Ferrimicrobium acidiphilum]|uniref:Inner membrane protein YghB n=3 Tax=Ferrimicrobium acidiphilum TaxID=121039 RepID=A0A0D8FXS9_9ACTN|nr:DedA family protein [Ferrimicrobium acidiphilum]KJE78078.1 inner membrane protein YghB [Ferrimicrobium acidiphilum DSM 19497]MCL5053267.1 DedA family protein [Gammaproteobacteria bacterium]